MPLKRLSAPGDWRAALSAYAEAIWLDPQGTQERPEAAVVAAALGALAEEALTLVSAYARGTPRPAGAVQPPPEFSDRLDIILQGIEAAAGQRNAREGAAGPRPNVIQSELWQMLQKVRESAELSYSRERDLVELDRRILFLLTDAGPLVPADITNAVGVDKAQVSRSVKRMLAAGLVEREQIRSPLRLTEAGAALGRRMVRLAELRNRELAVGISDSDLAHFFDTTEILLERAMALYEQEKALAQPATAADVEAAPALGEGTVRGGEKVVVDRARIISPLMTLSAYFSRSGALAFKRLTGLSTFEAFVLSEIGLDPPIEWSALVAVLARDHSQAGRTIQSLIARGLVARDGKPGRRHGRFYPTEEGARLYRIIHDAGQQRSDYLLAPLAGERRVRFLATFDKIRRNAEAQLDRERAFAELVAR